MFSKTLFIVLLVSFVSDYSYGHRDKEFFRKDYRYLDTSDSFYKIHTLHMSWFDAKRVCALEGASLFYPENDDEAQDVLAFWNATQPFSWVYVGISDLVVKGTFETIHGHPVTDVYHNWSPGEPNNANGVEDCVILRRDGTFNDASCHTKNPFICKRSLLSLEWNNLCNIPNLDYSFNADIGKCYKLHTVPLTWTDAYAACRAEQSYLAMSNNQLEADYLVNLTESAFNKRVGGDYFRGIYHMGFHNKLHAGWQTIRGTPMNVDADAWWDNREPIIDEHDQCGSMFFNGRLNTISCDTKSFFICEHDVNSSSLLQETNYA